MAWWKYKSLIELKWREPYEFTRILSKLSEKQIYWWTRPVSSLIITGMFVGMWVAIEPDPGVQRVSFTLCLAFSVTVGFGLVYLISSVNYFMPREISFNQRAIVSTNGVHTRTWDYNDIHKVRFERQTFGQKEFQIMLIIMTTTRRLVTAVPEKINVKEIIDLLKNKGIEKVETA